MKQSISLFLWFLPAYLICISLNAATTVSANLVSDTQWNKVGNPYVLTGNFTVPQGVMLSIGPGVQVVFQGSAQFEVDGTLLVGASAADPAIFNMTQGGLQSKFFLNSGTANIVNAKFLGGIFLAKDSQFVLEASDLTQGSGIYLQGVNTAKIKSCKIYGNATGLVSDGKNKITMTFDTIVQNTYGLFLKSFGELSFRDNSIHDNQVEVINNTPPYKLGGNFWGSMDEKAVMTKIQGGIDLKPMKSLKDVLRVYVQTQLPEITEAMSDAMAAKERRQEKAEKLAMKKLKEQEGLEALKAKKEKEAQSAPAVASSSAPPPPGPTTEQEATAPAAPVVSQPSAPQPEEAVAPELETTAPSGTVKVKALPAAPHQLTPVVLPPDQGNLGETPAGPPPAMESSTTASSPAPAPPAAPAVPAPPAEAPSTATGVPASTEIPLIPDSDLMPPPPPSVEAPPLPPSNAPVASTQPAPEVNNVSPAAVSTISTGNGEIPPPPGSDATATAPPAVPPSPGADTSTTVPPPPPAVPSAESTQPAAAATTAPPATSTAAPADNEEIPPPPPVESNTNVTAPAAPAIPSTDSIPDVPAPPATAPLVPGAPAAVAPVSSMDTTTPNVPTSSTAPVPAVPAPTPDQPTADQKKAVDALQGVNGDIDGMQAPPLDLGVGSSTPASGSTPSTSTNQKPADDSTLALPPLQDSEVKPPKDLDLPPTDDLGNVNLDSRNK